MLQFRSLTRVVGVIGVVLSVGCVAACGDSDSGGAPSTSGDSAKPVRVAMFMVTLNTHQQGMIEGAEQEAAEVGDVRLRTFSAEFDPNKQVQQIQTATASGQYDAFVINPVDGVRVIPAIKAAAAKGITVVCSFGTCGPDLTKFEKEMPELAAQTGIDAAQLGRDGGPIVNQACAGKDPCNLVVITGIAALAGEQVYVEELKSALDPNVKVVAEGEGQFLADPAYKAMKDILQREKDIDVVMTSGDQMTVGVEQATDDAGLNGVKLIGTGAGAIGTAAVAEGRWYATAVFRPQNDGRVGLRYAVQAARGKEVPALTNTQLTPDVPSGYLTEETAAGWTPEWAG